MINPSIVQTTRRERRKQEIYEKLLSAATQLISQQGCEDTSIDQIAELADVARKTFYHYFSTKQQLISVLCEKLIYERSKEFIEESKAYSASAIGRIQRYIQSAIKELLEFATLERALIRESSREISHNDENAARFIPQLSRLLGEIILEGQINKEVRNDFSAELLGQIISSAIDDISFRWVYDANYPVAEKLAELSRYVATTLPSPNEIAGVNK